MNLAVEEPNWGPSSWFSLQVRSREYCDLARASYRPWIPELWDLGQECLRLGRTLRSSPGTSQPSWNFFLCHRTTWYSGQEGPSTLYQGTSENCWLPPPKRKLMIRFGLPLGEGRAEYSPSPTSSWFPVSCAGEGHSLPMGYGCTWALGLLTTGSPKQPVQLHSGPYGHRTILRFSSAPHLGCCDHGSPGQR